MVEATTQRRMKAITIAVSAVSAVISLSAGAQNVLLNGSFESPTIASNAYEAVTPDSWTRESVHTVGIVNGRIDGLESLYPLPYHGQQYVSMGTESAEMSQQFTITHRGVYALTWSDYGVIFPGGVPTSPYSVSILREDDAETHTVTNLNLDANHGGLWQIQSLRVALSADTYILRFTAGDADNGNDTLLDNVRLQRLPEHPLDELIALVEAANLSDRHKRPLRASLEAAGASLNRNDPRTAIAQLRAFQAKVRVQIGGRDTALADALIQAAAEVITLLSTD